MPQQAWAPGSAAQQDEDVAVADQTLRVYRGIERDQAQALLELRGFSLSTASRPLLETLDLKLAATGVTAIVGPHAAGKSLLLRALAGMHSASWQVRGQRHYTPPPNAGRTLPLLAQRRPGELSLTLRQGLINAARQHPRVAAQEITPAQWVEQRLRELGLDHLLGRLDRQVMHLSPGDIRLTRLLYPALGDSPLLLFDDPANDLEPDAAERVLRLIAALGRQRACVTVLHSPDHIRASADRVLLLEHGRLLLDLPAGTFLAPAAAPHPLQARFLSEGGFPEEAAPPLRALQPPPEAAVAIRLATAPAPVHLPDPVVVTPSPQAAVDTAAEAECVHTPAITPAPPSDGSVTEDCDLARCGPRGFHWLIPGQLAGCQMPGVVAPLDYDLGLLRAVGITRLINLTDRAVPPEALARHGLTAFQLAVEDRKAPPLMWTKLLLARMETFLREGDVIAVHCLAGLGRTGVVLGAWLVRQGLTAEAALQRLRTIDPRYVQSDEQETLLQALETNLLIRVGSGLDRLAGQP